MPSGSMNMLYDAVVAGDAGRAAALTRDGLSARADPLTLVNESMMPAMAGVGPTRSSAVLILTALSATATGSIPRAGNITPAPSI